VYCLSNPNLTGTPNEVFTQLFHKFHVTHVAFESDTEPYAVQRDGDITQLAQEHKVQVIRAASHTLFDPQVVLSLNKGRVPRSYSSFTKLMKQLGHPSVPKLAPSEQAFKNKLPATEILEHMKQFSFHQLDFPVPTLKQLGYEQPEDKSEITPFKGGETEALRVLEQWTTHKQRQIIEFSKPHTAPTAFDPAHTTTLSPYVTNGALSSRTFYHAIQNILAESKGKHTQPPVSLHGQLFWREYFYVVASATPGFDSMNSNPMCKKIDWIEGDEADRRVAAWKEARTGYPWIDAAMTQLRKWGWLHHLARHAVACFLTRGDLYCSWERGRDVFHEYLIDGDWSLNNANWMWLSASCFYHQYFRVYSPIAFAKKTDPNGDFIRHFLPQFRHFPSKWIYEPWKAPLAVQRQHKLVVGEDYPERIVDHATVRTVNIARMKAAYEANRTGNVEQFLQGSRRRDRRPGAPSTSSSRTRSSSSSNDGMNDATVVVTQRKRKRPQQQGDKAESNVKKNKDSQLL
jgi:cryptochrome